MFRRQVFHFSKATMLQSSRCEVALVQSFTDSGWICTTCRNSLSKQRIPQQAASFNNLKLDPQPDTLVQLNALERHLVSPVIPFIKMFPRPKTMMKSIIGPCVCVPSNISTVADSLPRSLDDSTLIRVKLKRKMEYLGHHMFQTVNPENMLSALDYLKSNHNAYKGKFL